MALPAQNATLLLNPSRLIYAASSTAAALLGVDSSKLIGRSCNSVLTCCCGPTTVPCPAIRPNDNTEGKPVLTRAQESGHPLVVRGQLLVNGANGQECALLTLHDPEPADELINLLGRRLLPLDSLETNLQSVLDDLRRFFAADLAAIAFHDSKVKEIRWVLASGNQHPSVTAIRLRPGQGFAGRIVTGRKPLETASFPADLTRIPSSYPIFLQEGLQSGLGVPMLKNGQAVGVLMIGKRSPHKYSESERQILTTVADVLTLATENIRLYRSSQRDAMKTERRKLADEVHDGLSQHLFGLKLLLSGLKGSLDGQDEAEVQSRLVQIFSTLDSSLSEVRQLIGCLRGEEYHQPDLVTALCASLEDFACMSGLDIELSLNLPPGEMVTIPHAHEVLRIAQEALANASRHARARSIHVELAAETAYYRLQIADDGCGFDINAPPSPGHFGLSVMKERASRAGLDLTIASTPGLGTVTTLLIPLSDTSMAEAFS